MDGRWAIPPDGTRAEGDERPKWSDLFGMAPDFPCPTCDGQPPPPICDTCGTDYSQNRPNTAAGADLTGEQPPRVSQGGSGQGAAQKAALEAVEYVLIYHRLDSKSRCHCGFQVPLGASRMRHRAELIVDALAAAHLLRDAPGQDAGDGVTCRVCGRPLSAARAALGLTLCSGPCHVAARQDAGDEGLRERVAVARFTADHAHPLSLVIAALDGETDPAQLGIDDEAHAAFRALLDPEAKP